MLQQMVSGTVHEFNLDDHLALFREGTDRVQVLDPMARYIWSATRAGLDSNTVAIEIARQFDISPQKALQDVNNVIERWTFGLLAEPRSQQQQRTSYDPPKELYSHWQPATETTLCFPRFSVRIRYDSREISEILISMIGQLAASHTENTGQDHTMDVVTHPQHSNYLIIADNKVVETADSPMNAAVMTFRGITELACRRENWLAILHAGVIAWKEQGIILPSSGGTGKTTLTAALIRNGFNYLNDDVTPVERDTGKLVPIPVSLCIKSGSWSLLQPLYPELEQLKVFGRNNLRVKYLPPPPTENEIDSYTPRYLIVPNRQKGFEATLQAASPAEGLQAIIEGESLLPQALKPIDVKELTEWVKKLKCYRLTYDKIEPAVQAITQLVD